MESDNVIVVFNKVNHKVGPIDFNSDTLEKLQRLVAARTNVQPALQKLMLKGAILKDSAAKPLAELGVKAGTKILLVGSAVQDIVEVNDKAAAAAAAALSANAAATQQQGLGEGGQEKPPHKKNIEKGPPDDVMPGLRGRNEALPPVPLHGVVNSRGEKLRLTFKIYAQELVINSASSTERVPFGAVQAIFSEPIKGREEYSILGLQLGRTGQSTFWMYWVPSQYVRSIKSTLK